ncbi:MAG: SGNH hydrolase domain-containing protein [Cocleimonas sp.]
MAKHFKKSFITLFTTLVLVLSVDAELLPVDLKANGKYIRTLYLQLMKKPFVANRKKKALIIGDSHAQDFLNGVYENGYLSQYQISTRYIPTRCQIYLGHEYAKHLLPKDKVLCAKSDSLLQAQKQIAEADLVILSSKWRGWAAKALPQTIKNLKLSSKQKLIVIGTKSFGRYLPNQYTHLSKNALLSLRSHVDKDQNSINSVMTATLSKNIFVNVHQIVCGTSNTCPIFTDKLQPISIDGGHLTKDGARYVGKKLFKHALLASIK